MLVYFWLVVTENMARKLRGEGLAGNGVEVTWQVSGVAMDIARRKPTAGPGVNWYFIVP